MSRFVYMRAQQMWGKKHLKRLFVEKDKKLINGLQKYNYKSLIFLLEILEFLLNKYRLPNVLFFCSLLIFSHSFSHLQVFMRRTPFRTTQVRKLCRISVLTSTGYIAHSFLCFVSQIFLDRSE